jgi:hypothetical protein
MGRLSSWSWCRLHHRLLRRGKQTRTMSVKTFKTVAWLMSKRMRGVWRFGICRCAVVLGTRYRCISGSFWPFRVISHHTIRQSYSRRRGRIPDAALSEHWQPSNQRFPTSLSDSLRIPSYRCGTASSKTSPTNSHLPYPRARNPPSKSTLSTPMLPVHTLKS